MLPNGTKLNSLFYADHLITLSRSKLGLQNFLNKLSSYCNSWMLKINSKKNKIMVFQKGTKKSDDVFHIGNEIVVVIQDYTYLGTRISSSGNLHFHLNIFDKKPFIPLFSLRRHTDFIFDTMISPILTYNSDVWGGFGVLFLKSDFYSSLKKMTDWY